MQSNALYEQYRSILQKIADVKYASAVLQWDQETYLPARGANIRGQQIATLNEIAHQQFTDDALGDLLKELSSRNDLSTREQKNVELSLHDYNRNKKLSPSFVRRSSEVINKSYHAWIDARKKNSFDVFAQPLSDVIEIKRQEAGMLGYEGHPYNALMNDYDRGLTVQITDTLFDNLIPELSSLLGKIAQRPQVDHSFLHQRFGKQQQWDFGIEILKQMQFDFDAGRQDMSEHPFTTSFGSEDVRITTRIDENDFAHMLWSCIHEGGHALYEQGLPVGEYGLPLGEYCSLSIHESQSRLWENCIGRSAFFWKENFDRLKEIFPAQFAGTGHEDFYKAVNRVKPSLIRTEADELTYHFHVMIRYRIEKLLIEGIITSKDIPAIWNEYYAQYLGVKVPDDKQGCLQDVHWSHGSFGYFATYSIGSLYAAQLNAAISKGNSSLNRNIRDMIGHTHRWLQQHIYAFGRYYNSEDLCMHATGEHLNSQHFIAYANNKYEQIYDLS